MTQRSSIPYGTVRHATKPQQTALGSLCAYCTYQLSLFGGGSFCHVTQRALGSLYIPAFFFWRGDCLSRRGKACRVWLVASVSCLNLAEKCLRGVSIDKAVTSPLIMTRRIVEISFTVFLRLLVEAFLLRFTEERCGAELFPFVVFATKVYTVFRGQIYYNSVNFFREEVHTASPF